MGKPGEEPIHVPPPILTQTPTCIQEHLFPSLLCGIHFGICQKLNTEPISPHLQPASLGPLHLDESTVPEETQCLAFFTNGRGGRGIGLSVEGIEGGGLRLKTQNKPNQHKMSGLKLFSRVRSFSLLPTIQSHDFGDYMCPLKLSRPCPLPPRTRMAQRRLAPLSKPLISPLTSQCLTLLTRRPVISRVLSRPGWLAA